MGTYTFRWPYNASEVYVTGTFDDWGKTVRLDRNGDVFEKEVELPATDEKIQYKFVVDGIWTTDNRVPEEDDGDNNINNVLYPDQIQQPLQNGMAGVTPDSTTAALAAGVPRESSSKANGYHPIFSSAAPGSTTAKLGQEVPLEQRATVPGSYPVTPGGTPGGEAEQFSVNPIPASSGIGNPIKLVPGEKVPDSSTFNPNTIQSTARFDRGAYERGASLPGAGESLQDGSAFSLPPVTKNTIPESSLPMGGDATQDARDPGYTIQSAAPTSTTAALAAAVPLESQRPKRSTGGSPSEELPDVVKESLEKAHQHPEWAANEEVVEEKKEVEEELQQKISVNNSVGPPAPALSAATTETAPRPTGAAAPSSQLSSKAKGPTDGPVVTTGVDSAKAPKESGPGPVQNTSTAVSTAGAVAASDQLSPKEYEPAEPVVTTGVGSAKAPEKSGSGPVHDTSASVPTAGVTGSSATKTADSAVDGGSTAAAGDGSTSAPTAGVTGSSATKTADDLDTSKPVESKKLAQPSKSTTDDAVSAPAAGATGASATKTSDPTPATANTNKDASAPAQKIDAPTSTNDNNTSASASKPTNNNAATGAATNGKAESKKKKKGFFSRLKEKLKH
ncbi:carbohydrate-binding module family 48 protein [Aspergillus homomorphus CBS 101889]|uniref:AMP-activated protein kinase glycogen-binding domain-containing protein n=1 Tax=Aspergillus homomorphus (strain CBS 101889) TaxID=1450537 RepID=A0A395HTS8_ASPHC|nr:hypothetical protein BO97DRAFT_406678 [Aspergillus homomorphus CBS 101889]RAL10909.1 hypothetical protein BO97DRAFT_406678 [Aspergillus homomorphus CBS 101889]